MIPFHICFESLNLKAFDLARSNKTNRPNMRVEVEIRIVNELNLLGKGFQTKGIYYEIKSEYFLGKL